MAKSDDHIHSCTKCPEYETCKKKTWFLEYDPEHCAFRTTNKQDPANWIREWAQENQRGAAEAKLHFETGWRM